MIAESILLSLTSTQIREKILILRQLKDDMVGQLYPPIVEEEIQQLIDRYKYLTDRNDY